jgi:hypothetical protein
MSSVAPGNRAECKEQILEELLGFEVNGVTVCFTNMRKHSKLLQEIKNAEAAGHKMTNTTLQKGQMVLCD